MKPYVYVAVPTGRGVTEVETTQSLIEGVLDLVSKDIRPKVKFVPGDAMIHRARSMFAAHFMLTDCTHLFFVDDDVQWESGAMSRIVAHAVVHDLDIVAGVYPRRSDPLEWPVRWLPGKPIIQESTGLVEVAGVATGFMCISRRCIAAMRDHYTETKYRQPHMPGEDCWLLFDSEIIDGELWSEDMLFCRRWRKIGGKVWIDPALTFGHAGRKVYTGNLEQWLEAQLAVEHNAGAA